MGDCLTHIFLFFSFSRKLPSSIWFVGSIEIAGSGKLPCISDHSNFLAQKNQKCRIFGFFDRFNLKTVKKRPRNFFGTKNVALGKDIILFGFFAFIDSL